MEVLSGFLETIDSPKVNLRFAQDRDVTVFFSSTCNGLEVKSNEHVHLNEDGLIDSTEVAWGPLPATVEVQKVFASKLDFPAVRLVPSSDA